jgi:sigma-B regulation protein RsbU (phosphoserine phosphatase)
MAMLPETALNEIRNAFQLFTTLHPKCGILFFNNLDGPEITPTLSINVMDAYAPFLVSAPVRNVRGIILRGSAEDAAVRDMLRYFGISILRGFNPDYKMPMAVGVISDQPGMESDLEKDFKAQTDLIEILIGNYFLRNSLQYNVKRTQQLINEMSALHELGRSIESSQNLDKLLRYLTEKCMKLMNGEAASLMLLDRGRRELQFKVALGPKSNKVKPFRLKLGHGIAGWVAQHGEPILIPDAYSDPRFDPSFDKRSGFRTRSYLCAPLIYKKKVQGVLTVLNRLDYEPFTESDQELLSTFASQAALAIVNSRLLHTAIEKERLDKELQVASQIQQLLLPQDLPKIAGLDIAATYIPCKEVSGDFFDVIRLNENEYVLIVADVSGKSIPGALLVSTMQATLKAYFEYSHDLLSVIVNLNRRIMQQTTPDRYITFFFGIYNTQNNSFRYINAGHNPPILLSADNSIAELRTGGIFLGSLPWNYEQETIALPPDSVLLMYSDGLTEAMNSREEEFGEQRLKELLIMNHRKTAANIRQAILDGVNDFVNGQPFQDDFTLIVLHRDDKNL